MTRQEFLEPLARRRTDEVVVTTMSVVRPWGRISDHDLDLASADSAMGHAADLALGIAMACPDRRVLCLNGDGSMLMSLVTLVTIIEAGVDNLILFCGHQSHLRAYRQSTDPWRRRRRFRGAGERRRFRQGVCV